MLELSRISLVKRLSLFQVAVILIVMGAFSFGLSSLVTRQIEQRAEDNLKQEVYLIVNLISSYNSALAENALSLNRVFLADFPGDFSLDTEKQIQVGDRRTPVLKVGLWVVNLDTDIVDRFRSITHAECSVFVRSGNDFVRVATSFHDEKGNRLVGSVLDRTQPAYAHLLREEEFTGKTIIAGREFMSSYQPVKNADGKVVAVVATMVDFTAGLKSLTDRLLKIKIGKTGYLYAMDAAPGKDYGVMRIHPTKAGQNAIASKDARGFEFLRDILNRKEGVARYLWVNSALGETAPREKIVAFAYLKDWNWVVAAGTYTDELNTEGVFLRNAMLVAAVFAVLVLVSMFVLMARSWISQPLNRAVRVTDVLAGGDFRQIPQVEAEARPTGNEVAQLERGIYRMAASLCGVLAKIHHAAAQVTAASQEIAATASRSSETAQNQAEKTARVVESIREMSETVAGVNDHSQQAAEAARLAAETARSGGQVVHETLDVMRSIAGSTQAVSAKIGDLGQSTDRIGAIASLISEIAQQTNLLALNAAIEAARAGEQGRGFAVVAGEVRRLAERTASATKEIAEMIGTIQQEAREAVSAMQNGQEQVALGVAKTESCGHALDQIIEMAGRVGDMVAQIATSAAQQSASAVEVNGHVSDIADMNVQSSANARETAAACRDLSSLALGLQQVVGQFKLDGQTHRRFELEPAA